MNEEVYEIREIKKLRKTLFKNVVYGIGLYLCCIAIHNKAITENRNYYMTEVDVDVYQNGNLLFSNDNQYIGYEPKLEVNKKAIMKSSWEKNEDGKWTRDIFSYDLSEFSQEQIVDAINWDELDVTIESEVVSSIDADDVWNKDVIEVYSYHQSDISKAEDSYYDFMRNWIYISVFLWELVSFGSYFRDKRDIVKLTRKK